MLWGATTAGSSGRERPVVSSRGALAFLGVGVKAACVAGWRAGGAEGAEFARAVCSGSPSREWWGNDRHQCGCSLRTARERVLWLTEVAAREGPQETGRTIYDGQATAPEAYQRRAPEAACAQLKLSSHTQNSQEPLLLAVTVTSSCGTTSMSPSPFAFGVTRGPRSTGR